MPAISGSFSGKVKVQTALAVSDQPKHEINVAEIGGTQKSADENWNNAAINYWGPPLIVSVGRLGDITGRRRLLLAGIFLFTKWIAN